MTLKHWYSFGDKITEKRNEFLKMVEGKKSTAGVQEVKSLASNLSSEDEL